MNIKKFTFNPFQENTYVLFDDTNQCVIIDPGCYVSGEKKFLSQYIEAQNLKPVALLNTHCHLDHIFGNKYVEDTYDLEAIIHKDEMPILNMLGPTAEMYNVPTEIPKTPQRFLQHGDTFTFGDTTLEVLFTPGHSPGSISFYHKDSQTLISGDVLFHQSIGRTDLPMGDFDTLINSIKTQLWSLPDSTKVYSGHGPETTIGHEKKYNPFLNT